MVRRIRPKWKVFPVLVILSAPVGAFGQADGTESGPRQDSVPIGFQDGDGDGLNDLFRDADGDGVNDVNGTAYRHRFGFKDRDKDGVNDLWSDADGDGVNDLVPGATPGAWVDEDGDGIGDALPAGPPGLGLRKRVLDTDRNGKNDVTGEDISAMKAGRGRFGQQGGAVRRMDRFIDRDGDGIADDRARGNLLRQIRKQKRGRP
jgi:hypothetical protein